MRDWNDHGEYSISLVIASDSEAGKNASTRLMENSDPPF
jgi:hypothetical protein